MQADVLTVRSTNRDLAAATCVRGKRLCDMPVMLLDGKVTWTEKGKRYDAADVLAELAVPLGLPA